jgi:hypothetical protein
VLWCDALWRGVVSCGVVWCGEVWCGVVWCGVVWCVVVWCCGAVLLCVAYGVFVQVCLCPRVRVRAFASKFLIPFYTSFPIEGHPYIGEAQYRGTPHRAYL